MKAACRRLKPSSYCEGGSFVRVARWLQFRLALSGAPKLRGEFFFSCWPRTAIPVGTRVRTAKWTKSKKSSKGSKASPKVGNGPRRKVYYMLVLNQHPKHKHLKVNLRDCDYQVLYDSPKRRRISVSGAWHIVSIRPT